MNDILLAEFCHIRNGGGFVEGELEKQAVRVPDEKALLVIRIQPLSIFSPDFGRGPRLPPGPAFSPS